MNPRWPGTAPCARSAPARSTAVRSSLRKSRSTGRWPSRLSGSRPGPHRLPRCSPEWRSPAPLRRGRTIPARSRRPDIPRRDVRLSAQARRRSRGYPRPTTGTTAGRISRASTWQSGAPGASTGAWPLRKPVRGGRIVGRSSHMRLSGEPDRPSRWPLALPPSWPAVTEGEPCSQMFQGRCEALAAGRRKSCLRRRRPRAVLGGRLMAWDRRFTAGGRNAVAGPVSWAR